MRCKATIVGCVGVCVCVSSLIFPNSNELAKKTYGLPQRGNHLISNVFFRKTVSSRSYRTQVAAILTHLLAILLALAGAQARKSCTCVSKNGGHANWQIIFKV